MSENIGDLFQEVMAIKQAGEFELISALIPYAGLVGLELIKENAGLITILRNKPSNIGNTTIPAVHGGVVGALLEHAGIMHIICECDTTRFPKIINISIDYLRPCLGTMDTYARGYVIKQGKRVTNVRIEAWQSDPSRPVAAAHAHFLMG
ncbi:MAG: PaaI family thioesterase [Chromatiaceae bacterium]|nr:PaaI family thioesterase [Chromatiaceae bacterium]